MEKPIIDEQYTDNGEFSHWHLIDQETGCVLWSSFPEETIARGQKINPNLNDKHKSKLIETPLSKLVDGDRRKKISILVANYINTRKESEHGFAIQLLVEKLVLPRDCSGYTEVQLQQAILSKLNEIELSS